MKKPKKLRKPKSPKRSASYKTWKNYEDRVKTWEKRNKDRQKAYDDWKNDQKKKASLINKLSNKR